MKNGRGLWRPEVRGWSPPAAPTPGLFETLMGGFWTHQRCCLDQRWRHPRPLPGSVECGITHFSTSSAAKASVNSGSFSTASCRDLPSPILLICFQHLPVAESSRKLVGKELESRFSKIPEQMGEEQTSGCTVQVNDQHKEKWVCEDVPLTTGCANEMKMLVIQSCSILCDPVDCSPPGSSLSMEFSRQEYWTG